MATETWVLNETLTISGSNVYNNIEMTYSGQQRAYPIKSLKIYEYIDGRETAYSVLGQEQSVYSDENTSYELYGTGGGASGWFSYNGTLYNTWKFSQPVTDSTLLTWLQANGTKQETPSTNRTYDLSTNSKWASLSYGNHTVKIKAVGGGFGDSSFSNSAIVTKSVLERGTYKWIDNPTITADNQTNFSFTSNGESYTMVRTYVGAERNYISYTDNAVTGYFSGHGWGTHSLNNGEWSSMEVKPAYQIITLEDDIEVSTDFYNWAITGGNLVKQTEYTATVKVNGSCDAANCPIKLYDGSDANGTLLTTINENPSVGEVGTFSIKSGSLYIQVRKWTGIVRAWYQVNVNNETGDAIASTTETEVVPISSNVIITFADMYCLTGDTLITLADGSSKRIDQLTLNDKVLSYNPETLLLEPDEITYTDATENKFFTEYDKWTFEDGTIIKTVHRHRFYNVERQAMVYMDEWKIGEHAITIDGKKIALVSHETVSKEVRHYTIFTKNQNYFANGLLSGNRYTKEMLL